MLSPTQNRRDGFTNSRLSISYSPYIRLGDVLHLRRQYFPGTIGQYIQPYDEPRSTDDCRIINRQDIDHFRIIGEERWAEYDDIVRAFKEYASSNSTHNSPYKLEEVFAPIKIAIRDDRLPIRAALTFDPLFPTRAIFATLKDSMPFGMGYVALGVLNSAIGSAYCRPKASGNSSALSLDTLKRVPIAHRDYTDDDLWRVADIAYRIATLYEAARNVPGLQVWDYVDMLAPYLTSGISRLLRLREGEPEAILETVRGSKDWDSVSQQLTLADDMPSLPASPTERVFLLTVERDRLDVLVQRRKRGTLTPDEDRELDRLNEIQMWEERVNIGPPIGYIGRAEDSGRRSGDTVGSPQSSQEMDFTSEVIGGLRYEYYPIGRYIVSAPGVCGGRPTFKYTRIDVRHFLDSIRAGRSIDEIAAGYGETVPRQALEEALDLSKVIDPEFFENALHTKA